MTDQYSVKPESYFSHERAEILDLIPATCSRLLDVGCGTGQLGVAARGRYAIKEIVGIELFEPAAMTARSVLDRVLTGDVEAMSLDFPAGHFDCIVCADVLEHTKDPWRVLRSLRPFLADGGCLIVSLPNIRHLLPLFKIITNRLAYESSGILDRTHLRFFTLYTARQMLEETGFVIDTINQNRSAHWVAKLLVLATLGLARPFTVYQYIFRAHKAP